MTVQDAAGVAAPDDGVLHRRARVLARRASAIDVVWAEAQCRGCGGCGGRCNLFGKGLGETETLPLAADIPLPPGADVVVVVPRAHLQRSAARAYATALVGAVAGTSAGHVLGSTADAANLGALVGLLAGTFAAGWLTKRVARVPRMRVLPIPNSDPAGGSCP